MFLSVKQRARWAVAMWAVTLFGCLLVGDKPALTAAIVTAVFVAAFGLHLLLERLFG